MKAFQTMLRCVLILTIILLMVSPFLAFGSAESVITIITLIVNIIMIIVLTKTIRKEKKYKEEGDMMSDITTKKDIKGEITAYILDYIKKNKLQPGEKKLPSQAELVKQLKVSRTAVRETVIELEGKDIIHVINGKGMYVKDPSENHLLSGLELERKKRKFD